MRTSSLLINGVQIRRVGKSGTHGVITFPKELIGKFVKVSLLTEKEQLELQKKLENAKELAKEIKKRKEQLRILKMELDEIRRLRSPQKTKKFSRLSRIKSLKNERRKTSK